MATPSVPSALSDCVRAKVVQTACVTPFLNDQSIYKRTIIPALLYSRGPLTHGTTTTTDTLIEHLFQLLVGRVHNAPAEERTCAVHADAFVHISQLSIAIIVHLLQRCPHTVVRSADPALHRHLDHVQRVEQRADKCTDAGTRHKLLRPLRQYRNLRRGGVW